MEEPLRVLSGPQLSCSESRDGRLARGAAYLVWPLFLAAATAVVWITVGPSGDVRRVFVAAIGLTGVLLVLERLFPRRSNWDAFSDPQIANDAAHGVLQNEIGTRLGDLALLVVVAGSQGSFIESGSRLWPSDSPLPLQILLAVFLADGLEYWRHRLLHEVSWLWPIHALHHSAKRMHVLKGARLHALDLLLRYLAVFAPLIAFGIPRPLVLWYAAALLIIGPISHGNLALRFPRWVHRVLVTPPEHHLHHASDVSLAMSNYAPVFPIWDIVFGTFRHPDAHVLVDVGIADDPVPAGFFGQCLTPLRLASRR